MHKIIRRFKDLRIIPVITIHRCDDAMPLADTLVQSGLSCAEITLRTEAAVDTIEMMSTRGDILVGAGTVLKIDQAKAALDAGARFMVSPGLNPKVAGYCIQNRILYTPGISTPSEIEAALDLGLHVLKFFPAEAFGGVRTLKAVSGPYPDLQFIPTGGITPENLADYLRLSNVLACGGSWIAGSTLIADGRFDVILKNAQQAAQIARTL